MIDNSNKLDFIKCGSPLGEYELHCDEETKQKILENEKLRKLVEERLSDKTQYQPEITKRKEGLLNMCDAVDEIRDREYQIYKGLLKESQA